MRIHKEGDYYRVIASSLLLAQLKIRNDYPGTYCTQLHDGSIELGYGAAATSEEDEFLRIHIGIDGSIRLQRDCFITLPLFYASTANTLTIGDSYEEVIQAVETPTLNQHRALRLLMLDKDYSGTLWNEVDILGERQILHMKHGVVTVQQPPTRAWATSVEAPQSNPRLFRSMLEETFAYFCRTRLNGQKFV
ncbi:MAG: hypothetical protein ABWY71_01975, partial [Candidatus Saccharimonadales bacterium]